MWLSRAHTAACRFCPPYANHSTAPLLAGVRQWPGSSSSCHLICTAVANAWRAAWATTGYDDFRDVVAQQCAERSLQLCKSDARPAAANAWCAVRMAGGYVDFRNPAIRSVHQAFAAAAIFARLYIEFKTCVCTAVAKARRTAWVTTGYHYFRPLATHAVRRALATAVQRAGRRGCG